MSDSQAVTSADRQGPAGSDSASAATSASHKPALLRDADLLERTFWTVRETAFMCRVGVRTVWRLMADPQSKFPKAHRVRGRTLLARDEVLAFLNGRGGAAR